MKAWKVVLVLLLAGMPILGLLTYGEWRVTHGHDPREAPTPLVGKAAAEFSRETLKGDTVRLADLGNQPLVINFWASWCIPCQEEHPLLIDFERRYHGRVRLVGVLYEDTRSNGIRWFQERGGDWTNLLDPRGKLAIEYGVRGVPETFFITRDRCILHHHPAPVTPEVLDEWVTKLLATDSTTHAPCTQAD